MTDSTPSAPDTIVFIHGLWMTPKSWEGWQARYEQLGYRTIAPAWPGFEGKTPQELRADPSSIAGTSASDVLAHFEGVIKALSAPPIIIGHSFGGAFTQALLSRGYGAAGVAVDSGTVKGIPDLPLSTIRSAFGVLGNPLNYGKAVPFTPKQFKYAFGNTLSEADSQAAWEQYAVPAASKVLFAGAAANLPGSGPFAIDFKKADRAPLLFIAGGDDHVVPAKVNRKNAAKYAPPADFKLFEGRSHFTAGEPGWEAVADYAIAWVRDKVGAPVMA